MIKIVGLLTILLSFAAHALVPLEGILLGPGEGHLQNDPLNKIFSDIYDKSRVGENNKIKLYQSTYLSGQSMAESCPNLAPPVYFSSLQEKEARRSIAASLQYIGLDTTIKAIGAYARKLKIEEDGYNKLKRNLIDSYCSKNLTVFSHKTVDKSLDYYYKNPIESIIPTIESSPFATDFVKNSSEKLSARSREFDHVIKNFRAFCSWGNDVEDYRMLTPYLNNPFIMSFVFKNLLGVQDKMDIDSMKVFTVSSKDTVQVVCEDLICRKEKLDKFKARFPLSSGSTGLGTDLPKIYCGHFRFTDSSKETIAEVKKWLKNSEIEDSVFETSQFISLMTGVPDFFNGVDDYAGLSSLSKSSVDERWNTWARRMLGNFSRELPYEESLRVKIESNHDVNRLRARGLEIDLSVTLGELDRLLVNNDKLQLEFSIKLSKNYLRHVKNKLRTLEERLDAQGIKNFRSEIAKYIDIQIKDKEKLFSQKMWNEEFPKLIAEELMQQSRIYEGPLFDTYQDEIVKIPVKFSYGVFAISYLRYRGDVASGRLNSGF